MLRLQTLAWRSRLSGSFHFRSVVHFELKIFECYHSELSGSPTLSMSRPAFARNVSSRTASQAGWKVLSPVDGVSMSAQGHASRTAREGRVSGPIFSRRYHVTASVVQ